jgi:hypothetical protein
MLMLVLTGCAMDTEYASEGHGYAIERRHEHNSSTSASIEYQPPELLAQNEIDQAKKDHRAPDLASVPAGGRVTVHLHGHNQHAGNPKNYHFTVADQNGNVIKQETGPDRPSPTPNNVKASQPVYEGTHTIDLDKPVNAPIKLNVVNTMSNSKEEYTIRPPAAAATSRASLPPGAAPRMMR